MISGENKIQDFFPYWKQFFTIAGILIWLIEILSMFTFNITHSISIEEIVLNFIIPFSWEFSQGYAIGVIAPLFYYYFKNRKNK